MQRSMGSPTLSAKGEAGRKLSAFQMGDIISIHRFTHVWGEPPVPEGTSHIARGSIPMNAGKKVVYHCAYLGNGDFGEVLSDEEIEKRMNALGWYRQRPDA